MTYVSIEKPPAEISSFEEALYHTGSQAEFEQGLKNFLAKPSRSDQWEFDSSALRNLLNDDRNLRLAYRELQLKGEKAPGVDGIRFEVIPACKLPPLLRDISRALKDHSYNPGPVREAKIPKPNGSPRTLCIRNLIDRVVAKAYQQNLSPLFDQTFCDLSHGGRPKRDRQTALTSALYTANQQDRWYCVGIDLKDAFDRVPLGRLEHILRKLGLEDPQLREMILHVAKASDKHGLQQGCALSPLLFNLYLDRVLDRRWIPKIGTRSERLAECQPQDYIREDRKACWHDSLAETVPQPAVVTRDGIDESIPDSSSNQLARELSKDRVEALSPGHRCRLREGRPNGRDSGNAECNAQHDETT